jgi:hypothetical protein
MRDYWPVIINDAYDEYKKGTGDQYKDLLEKILPESVKGEDAVLGTPDDKMINIPQPGEGNLINKNTEEYAILPNPGRSWSLGFRQSIS